MCDVGACLAPLLLLSATSATIEGVSCRHQAPNGVLQENMLGSGVGLSLQLAYDESHCLRILQVTWCPNKLNKACPHL
jgi:hypothetical protein